MMRPYTLVDYASQAYSILVAGLIIFFHNETVPAWGWLVAAHVAGVALVHWIVQQRDRPRPSAGLSLLSHFYPILLYLWFFAETGWLNRMFVRQYLDPLAVRWDQALFGCQPGIILIDKMPWIGLSEALYAAYFSYYLMIPGVGIALFLRNRQQFFHYLSVLSFLFYACYLIYIFVPIIGPRVLYESVNGYIAPAELQLLVPSPVWPAGVQSGFFFRLLRVIYGVFESPGSAIPSSHVAAALCTVHFSFRYLRPIRFFHLGLAILLCLATVYGRFHYGVDALGGLAAAAVLIPLGNWLYFKFNPRSEGGVADPAQDLKIQARQR